MQKITRGTVTRYAFDYHDPVVLTVEPGEAFQVGTLQTGSTINLSSVGGNVSTDNSGELDFRSS